MKPNVKVHNAEGMSQHDVSVEEFRMYHYKDGSVFYVPEPMILFLKRDENGDSHRIVTKSGLTVYPTRGWIGISWYAPGENVSF